MPTSTPQPVRAVALVVHGEGAPIERLVVGDEHASIAAGDRLELVEAVGPDGPVRADPATAVGRAERLRAVLDQGEPVPVGHRSQLGDPARVAEHVDHDDRPGPWGDPRLDIGWVEVERLVDLSEDGPRPGVDD